MEAVNSRSARNKPEVVRTAYSRSLVGSSVPPSQRIFPLRPKPTTGRPVTVGDGYQKLKNRLISHGLPESIIDELLEQPTIVSYGRGAFIFLQGATTDLLFWVSSGLVDIICPGPRESRLTRVCLVLANFSDLLNQQTTKGRPAQAFQARARTNAQIGLVIRAQVYKVLARQDPALLLQILQEVIAAWSELTLVIRNSWAKIMLPARNGPSGPRGQIWSRESRGTLLIPEFGHDDFAEMIGCSRPMVSRLLSKMIFRGTLAQSGKHYIILNDAAVNTQKHG